MDKIVAINIKSQLKLKEINDLISFYDEIGLDKKYIIFPTSIYLPFFINKKYLVGIQNISSYEEGAYTGQIAASQAKSLGVNYVLLNHLEVKKHLKDNNIKDKIFLSLKNNLKVILCISSIEELEVLKIFKDLNNIIIAYEPESAVIGKRKVDVNQIEKALVKIKKILYNHYGTCGLVLYGGNIDDKNILNIVNISSLDGYLISTNAMVKKQFLKIKEVIDKQ